MTAAPTPEPSPQPTPTPTPAPTPAPAPREPADRPRRWWRRLPARLQAGQIKELRKRARWAADVHRNPTVGERYGYWTPDPPADDR